MITPSSKGSLCDCVYMSSGPASRPNSSFVGSISSPDCSQIGRRTHPAPAGARLDPGRKLGIVGEDLAHRVGGAPRRGVVVVGVALEGERGGGVPREGLQVADGLAVLGEQAKAGVP